MNEVECPMCGERQDIDPGDDIFVCVVCGEIFDEDGITY